MKVMPQSFEDFQRNGVLDFSPSTSSDSLSHNQKKWKKQSCYVGTEPTCVLDTKRRRSPPTSSSTLSSSLGSRVGTGSTDTTTTGVAAVSWNPSQASLNISVATGVCGGMEKCGLGMDDWESVLSESAASPSQERSILRMIMEDNEDPYGGINKLLQTAGVSQNVEFNGSFGMMNQGSGFEAISIVNLGNNIDHSLHGSCSDLSDIGNQIDKNNPLPSVSNQLFCSSQGNFLPGVYHQQQSIVDENQQLFSPQVVINQNQAQYPQNASFFLQLPHTQMQEMQEHHLLSPPTSSKRPNSGSTGHNQVQKVPFLDSGQELFVWLQQQQQQHLQLHPYLQQRPIVGMKQKIVCASGDGLENSQLQQSIVEPLYQSAKMIEIGNLVHLQSILARLNHQLFPIGKPLQRVAFYFKEALQLLLPMNTTHSSAMSPSSIIFKIRAYKSFSEVSPILQFANFTCNQAILEALEGFERVHILDFDIGYGEQWASLMQELALRNGAPSLKVTAFASPSTHSELELGFAQENLKLFASDVNMAFEFEVVNLESLNAASLPMHNHISESEAVAVNLPISSFSNYPSSLPMVLHFIKQLSPKILVSLDRDCERMDASFPDHIMHAFQYYSTMLESIDAVNINLDAQQNIEKFLLQPSIEKIVLGRQEYPDKMCHWKSMFLSSGFTPVTFSNITESQAECLVQRTPVRGFHVEKRQPNLVLCWQQRVLISIGAWRC